MNAGIRERLFRRYGTVVEILEYGPAAVNTGGRLPALYYPSIAIKVMLDMEGIFDAWLMAEVAP